MNDDLQKQLAELLKQLAGAASDAGKWVAGQLPPLVQEKIAYGRASETLYLVLFLVGAVGCYRLAKHLSRVMGDDDDAIGAAAMTGMVFSGVGGILLAIFAVIQVDSTLKVWFAPRLYIVEWLASLVKK